MRRLGFLSTHATVLRRAAGATGAAGLRHAPPGGDPAPPLLLGEHGDDALAVEWTGAGARCWLRERTAGTYLSAGDQGGAVARSRVPGAWETFVALDAATLAALAALVAEGGWRAIDDDGAASQGALSLAHGFLVRHGDGTHDLAHGFTAALLGGDPPRRALLATAAPRRAVLLVRGTPRLVWRHDGTRDADFEIGTGLAMLARLVAADDDLSVVAECRDPAALAAMPDIAPLRPRLTLAPPGGGLDPVEPEGASAARSGPLLLLLNGVVPCRPLGAVFRAIAAAGRPLATAWRRERSTAFGPGGPWRAESEGGAGALAVEPSVLGLPDGLATRRLLAAALALATDADTARGDDDRDPNDGALADALRAVAAATGTPFDPWTLDPFVTRPRVDTVAPSPGGATMPPVAALLDARAMAAADRRDLLDALRRGDAAGAA